MLDCNVCRDLYEKRSFRLLNSRGNGVDIKAVSEQLGHKTVKTTYNMYVHLLDDTKAKEIDKLDGIDKFIA